MRIWKYQLSERVEAPTGGIVRSVGLDPGGRSCVWIEVDPDQPPQDREFAIIGTGWEFVPGGTYVGTFADGAYVWHVYEFRP